MKHGNVLGYSFCVCQRGDLAQDRASWGVREAHGLSLHPQEAETQVGFSVQDVHQGEPVRPDLWEGGRGSGNEKGETLDCDAGGPVTASAVPTGSPVLGTALQSCPALAQEGLASIPRTDQTVDVGHSRKGCDRGRGGPLQPLKVCARGVRHTSAYRIHDPTELGPSWRWHQLQKHTWGTFVAKVALYWAT